MLTQRMLFSVVVLGLSLAAQSTHAQMQTHVLTPWRGMSNGFYERFGVSWGFRQQTPGGFFFFNNGGPGPLPPFGGFDPGAQASFGIGGRSGDLSWNFGVVASQGNSQSIVSQTPSIVLPNGAAGFVYDAFQRPFVMGLVPVVGAQPISPLRERWLRLQYQRAMENGGVDRAEGGSTDELLNVSQGPVQPRKDDPPLILGKD